MAAKQITREQWESYNSRWLWWTYFPFTSPIAFFTIARKGKKPLWYVYGFFFLAFWVVYIVYQEQLTERFANDIGGFLLAVYIGGIVLARFLKKEYLMRLEILESDDSKRERENEMRARIANELFGSAQGQHPSAAQAQPQAFAPAQAQTETQQPIHSERASSQPQPVHSPTSATQQDSADAAIIDINTCDETALAQLPGITLIQAKKAVNYRATNSPFKSVDEFYQVIGLKPHIIAQIEGRITCTTAAPQAPAPSETPHRRQLDL